VVVETGGVRLRSLHSGFPTLLSASRDRYSRYLEIRQIVREDAILLYGFSESTEKRAFDLLTGVQHVGPKLAQAILSVLSAGELAAAVHSGDVERI